MALPPYSEFIALLCDSDRKMVKLAEGLLEDFPESMRPTVEGQYLVVKNIHALLHRGKISEAQALLNVAKKQRHIIDRIYTALQQHITNKKDSSSAPTKSVETKSNAPSSNTFSAPVWNIRASEKQLVDYFQAHRDAPITYEELLEKAVPGLPEGVLGIQKAITAVRGHLAKIAPGSSLNNIKGKGYEFVTPAKTGISSDTLPELAPREVSAFRLFYHHDRQVVPPEVVCNAVWKDAQHDVHKLGGLITIMRSHLPPSTLLVSLWKNEGYLFNSETNIPQHLGLAYEQYVLLAKLLQRQGEELPRREIEEALIFARGQLRDRTVLKRSSVHNAITKLQKRIASVGTISIRKEKKSKNTFAAIEGCTLVEWKHELKVPERDPVVPWKDEG